MLAKVYTVEYGVTPGGEYLVYHHPCDPRGVDIGTSVVSNAPLTSGCGIVSTLEPVG